MVKENVHLKTVANEFFGIGGSFDVVRKRWSHTFSTELGDEIESVHSRVLVMARKLTLNMAPMKPSPSQGREPASISIQMQPKLQISAFAEYPCLLL